MTNMPVKEKGELPIIQDGSTSKACEERVLKERDDAFEQGKESQKRIMEE